MQSIVVCWKPPFPWWEILESRGLEDITNSGVYTRLMNAKFRGCHPNDREAYVGKGEDQSESGICLPSNTHSSPNCEETSASVRISNAAFQIPRGLLRPVLTPLCPFAPWDRKREDFRTGVAGQSVLTLIKVLGNSLVFQR